MKDVPQAEGRNVVISPVSIGVSSECKGKLTMTDKV